MYAIPKSLLQHVPAWVMNTRTYDVLGETPAKLDDVFPSPTWTFAKKGKDGQSMPQTIAHRGYKAKHPENTMGAFKGAVAARADAIETDIHLSRDGKVVLSHDATLLRCFGIDQKVIDSDWDYISTLRTLKEPPEPMPLLSDLLEYLASPGLEHVWLLLDIKVDNDADTVMRLIGETIRSVPPNPHKPWEKRICLGIWAMKYLPLCAKHLPTFPATHIGFSTTYASQFLPIPSVTFNMLQKILFVWPTGPAFIRAAHARHRSVLAWTVNEDEMMRWSISKGLDGVITDDPKRFREVCAEWRAGKREVRVRWRTWAMVAWVYLMVCVFGGVFRWRMRTKGKGLKKGRRDGEDEEGRPGRGGGEAVAVGGREGPLDEVAVKSA